MMTPAPERRKLESSVASAGRSVAMVHEWTTVANKIQFCICLVVWRCDPVTGLIFH